MFYEVAPDIALAVIPKVASQSLREAIESFNGRELTLAQALEKPRKVVLLRDPVVRAKSVFNHYYGATAKCHTDMTFVLPPGIITADGYRLRGGVDQNPHHFTPKLQAEYLARVETKRAGRRISNVDLARELDADDYRRFIDYVLSGAADRHWLPQIDLITFEGKLFANEIIQFEDINEWWTDNVGKGMLPRSNSWLPVEKPDYRESDLSAFYVKDFERRL